MVVERLRATTPADISDADLAPLTFEEARMGLMPTEIATSISHHRAWRRMLDDGQPYALILEDDCEISPQMPAFLDALDRHGGLPGVVKLETRMRGLVLARRSSYKLGGASLHRTLTWEWGAAAYVISAPEARRVLASPLRFKLPIDDTLLSPASPLYLPRRILQTVPAFAYVPDEGADGGAQPSSVRESDAQAERQARFQVEKPKKRVGKIHREIRRIQRQISDVRTFLRHRILGRKMAVPFASTPVVSERSSVVPPLG